MKEHINKNLIIDQIADSAGFGKTHFYELFLKEKGCHLVIILINFVVRGLAPFFVKQKNLSQK